MSVKPRVQSGSSQQVLQTVAWAFKSGFRPVATIPKSKAAISRAYVDLDYKPPTIDFWKANDYGVGVVTGPAHSGPVDADLDCEEAMAFARAFLPPSDAVFGRRSKPRSHYLYRTEGVLSFEKLAFVDPVRLANKQPDSTIIELRGDRGHQTVMPGSIHQDTGEIIEWSDVPFPDVPSVDPTALTRAAKMVAIATLIVRYAWVEGARNEITKHMAGMLYHLEWPVEDVELLISTIMEYTDDRDKSRIPTVRTTYRRAEQGKKTSGAGVLRKQLQNDKVVDRLLEWAGSPGINTLQQYNDRFAVVAIEGKFRIADLDVQPGESPTFYHKDDFLNLTATDYSDEVDDKGKRKNKARQWLSDPRRRTFKRVDFVPGGDLPDLLNLWTGWAIEPSKGKCDAFLELLRDVICGGDSDGLFTWMLHWLANILREPLNKSLTAPVIIGIEGAGKSLMLGYFGRILGPAYTVVTNEEHVHGKFNKHVASTLLLHSEEALYGGERKHAGIIRSLITDEFRIFEQKGVDARRVRNYLRLVLTSNEAHAAPAKPGDRRYTVIDMGNRKASETLVKAVLEEMNSDGPAALHEFLTTMKYDPAIPRINVKNEALAAMKEINLTPLEAWWYETLAIGQVLPDYLGWATEPAMEDWPQTVARPALHAAMTIYVQDHGARFIPSTTLFALQLNKFIGAKLSKQQRQFSNPLHDHAPRVAKLLGDRQYAVTDMPDLLTCRVAFEKYLGQEIEWPSPAPKTKKSDAY